MVPYLFKRKKLQDGTHDPAAPYYTRFVVRRRAYVWCCKTNLRAMALKNASGYRDNIVAERYNLASNMKARNGGLNFARMLDLYASAPLGVSRPTITKNLAAFKVVLEANKVHVTDRVERLSRKLLVEYQRKQLASGVPASTINSRCRAAKSILSARALMAYEPAIPRELVEDFKMVPTLPEPERLPELPTESAMVLAHAQLPPIPAYYRAFLLAAYAGLRSGEIAAARWDWLQEGCLYVGGREFTAKSRKWRVIGIAPDVVAALQGQGVTDLTGFIVGAGASIIVKRELPAALKALGFTSSKPVHSLRRWYGSKVATASGLFAAQTVLGHSSPTVTSEHYARLLNQPPAVAIGATRQA